MIISTQEISPQKLFEVIQKEYLICLLREQIYPLNKHKWYWSALSKKKKEKIFDLKIKYNLPSIFDDKLILDDYKIRAFNMFGLPNFYYPNEKVKDQQIYWDTKNYFALGHKFIFKNKDDYSQKEGILKRVFSEENLVHIECEGKLYELSYDEVSRKINLILS